MKIKYFLVAALAILGLAGCSDAQNDFPEVDSGEVKGYLSLRLTGDVNTRTSEGSEGTDGGIPAESTITGVTVLIANNAGLVTSVHHPSITGVQTEAFKVSLGTHYVYALVNDPGVNIIDESTNINDIVETVANAANATSGYKDGKFFMVNARNSSSELGGVPVNITSNHTITAPAPVTIKVDRVATKITDITTTPTVTSLASSTANFVTGVDVAGYALLNVRKEFNVLQKWGTNNYSNGDPLTQEVLVGVPFESSSTILVKDKFFHHIGEYTQLVKDGNGAIIEINDISSSAAYTATDKYMTENRPEIKFYGAGEITAGRGVTSGVIYRVQAKNAGGDLPTFYVYKDQIFANRTALEAHEDFVGVTLPTTAGELRGKGIKVYENGIMYYTHFIKDPNVAHTYGGKNYYAVFRNSIYKLNIASIKDLGDDVPGGDTVDPEEPGTGEPGNPDIDTEEAYIQVTVTINPWVLNTINIDF